MYVIAAYTIIKSKLMAEILKLHIWYLFGFTIQFVSLKVSEQVFLKIHDSSVIYVLLT